MAYEQKKFIRIKDACERYSLSRSTFNRAFDGGQLTRIKRGRAVLIEVVEIDKWITSETA